MIGDGCCNCFYLRAGDLEHKFVIVFEANLLDTRQRVPPVFYDIIEVSPAFVVVKISGCFGANTPDLVELTEDFEGGVGFEVGDCLEFAIAGLVFVEEMGNLLVAATHISESALLHQGIKPQFRKQVSGVEAGICSRIVSCSPRIWRKKLNINRKKFKGE